MPLFIGISLQEYGALVEPSGRNGGNRWQMGQAVKRLQRSKPVVVACDRLPIGAHGKEGVDWSSPATTDWDD
jgi:hypothetical protein